MLSEDKAVEKLEALRQFEMHPKRQADIKTVIMQANSEPTPADGGLRHVNKQRVRATWGTWIAGVAGFVVVAGGLYAVSKTFLAPHVHPAVGARKSVNAASLGTHKNGTIASMKPVTYPGQNPDIQIYRMFYWSEGKKVEAYVTELKYGGPAQYPLVVDCHGGWVTASPLKHYVTSAYPLSLVAKTQSLPVVTVYPEYRGYADSQGTVHGLLGDTIDTENAIRAADSLKSVNNSILRLWGNQMGAGVALMVASDPQFAPDTQDVVAINPFVGWDTVGAWSKKHYQSSTLAQYYLDTGEAAYGKFNPNAKAYQDRSPNISVLQTTPVLLLQGTGETRVPWQSVQMFYQQLKKAHDPVTLDMIPNGNALLSGPYRSKANADIQKWINSLY